MSLIDTTTGNINSSTTQSGSSNQLGSTTQQQVQGNVYNGQQLGLQGLANGFIGNMLMQGGNGNQAMADYANYNFSKYEEPKMANTFGAGSPNIQGARQEMNLGLAAQAGQQQFQQQLGAYDAAQRYATLPQGQVMSQSGTQAQNTIQNQNTAQQQHSSQVSLDGGALLDLGGSMTLQGLAGGFLRF